MYPGEIISSTPCCQDPSSSTVSGDDLLQLWTESSVLNDTINTSAGLVEGFVYFDRPEEMLIPWRTNQYFFFIVTTYLLTSIVGVSGNVIVISVMAGDRASRNVTGVFLVSLAVADLLLLLICAVLDVAHYFAVQWDTAGTICKAAAYAETVSAFASVLNLVAVTLERFVVIVFPIRSRSLCTMSNCKRLMVIVWIVSLMLAVPIIFIKNTTKTTFTNYKVNVTTFSCKEDKDWKGLSVAWYRLVTLFALPSGIMVVCYIWVIMELWVSTKTMDQLTQSLKCSHHYPPADTEVRLNLNQDTHTPHTNCRLILRGHANSEIRDVKKARQQVIKMLILVVLLFLLCWGPRLIMEIVVKCCLNVFNHWVYTTRIIFYLLPFIHSCLNPIVYCFMSTKFRRRMMRCFGRVFVKYCCGFGSSRSKHPTRLKSSTSSVSRNGTTRIGSTYTFTSYAPSTVPQGGADVNNASAPATKGADTESVTL